MSLVHSLKVFVIIFNLLTICINGDTGNLPMDLQSLSTDNERQMAMYPNTIYYPNRYSPYPHQGNVQSKSVNMEPQESKVTYDNFFDTVNDLTDHDGVNSRSRAASKFAPLTYSKPLTYSYQKPSYSPWPSNVNNPSLLTPSMESTDLWKPRFGLLESDIKTPNKLGSLLNLGVALLGGSGFKETLINNILRPLLASKSGIKSLVAKLSIPVVALILINVEILVVVWWLWEECPEVQPMENTTPFSSQTRVSNISSFE